MDAECHFRAATTDLIKILRNLGYSVPNRKISRFWRAWIVAKYSYEVRIYSATLNRVLSIVASKPKIGPEISFYPPIHDKLLKEWAEKYGILITS